MSDILKPTKFIEISPAPKVLPGSVRLYQQTWVHHVMAGHPDVDPEHVRKTLQDPCYIHESKTRPDDAVVFTSEQCTNADGDPLWVPVRKEATGSNFVTSAYYKQNPFPGKIVWRRGDA